MVRWALAVLAIVVGPGSAAAFQCPKDTPETPQERFAHNGAVFVGEVQEHVRQESAWVYRMKAIRSFKGIETRTVRLLARRGRSFDNDLRLREGSRHLVYAQKKSPLLSGIGGADLGKVDYDTVLVARCGGRVIEVDEAAHLLETLEAAHGSKDTDQLRDHDAPDEGGCTSSDEEAPGDDGSCAASGRAPPGTAAMLAIAVAVALWRRRSSGR